MKKISILPLAEKIDADNMYGAASGKRLPSVTVPPALYVVLGVIAFLAVYTYHFFGVILIGAVFLIAGIDARTGKYKKGRTFEKVIWLRFPMFLIGGFLIITGVFLFLMDHTTRNSNTEKSMAQYFLLLELCFIVLAILAVSRLIQLVATALAIQKRMEQCSALVRIEPDVTAINCSGGTSKGKEYDCAVPVYKYYYEGKGYRFKDYERVLYYFSPTDTSLVFVDPEKPERYFSHNLFSDNEEKLIDFLKVLAYLLISLLPLLGKWMLSW